MLTWAIVFLVLALVLGALGFTGISGTFLMLSKILFGIFLIIFVILLILAFAAGT